MTADAIVSAFSAKPASAGRWRAQCPVHKGRDGNLSLIAKADRMQINCFGGCQRDDIWQAVGLTWKDAFYERRGKATQEQQAKRRMQEQYDRIIRMWSLATWLDKMKLARKIRREVVPLGWLLYKELWLANGYTPMMARWASENPMAAETWAAGRVAESIRKREAERETISTIETEIVDQAPARYFAERGAVFGREEVRAYLVPRPGERDVRAPSVATLPSRAAAAGRANSA